MQPLILRGFLIGGVGFVVRPIPANFFSGTPKDSKVMNDQIDIFELFRDVFSVKTTDIEDLMPTKAEQLEEVLK